MSRAPSFAALAALESALASFRISSTQARPATGLVPRRHASHAAQGRANQAKDGPGKRLGAKKSGGQYVVPGTILYRQRGTVWFPGDNCFMGRDHTIHASAPGYVTYYKDPNRHPDRKYVGIVFERSQTLPVPLNAPRRRKLGMLAYQMAPETLTQEISNDVAENTASTIGDLTHSQDPATPGLASRPATTIRQRPQAARQITVTSGPKGDRQQITLTMRRDYQYRQANWEIGRAAERSREAQKVRPFRPGDRFAAWRKAAVRKARNAERRAMGRGGKGGKKR